MLATRLNKTRHVKRTGKKIKQQTISYWFTLGHVPHLWVLPVEEVTGISRYQLRPDIYPPTQHSPE